MFLKWVFVGQHERVGVSRFMSQAGLQRGAGIYRLPPADRWNAASLDECRGLPWNPRSVERGLPAPAFACGDAPVCALYPPMGRFGATRRARACASQDGQNEGRRGALRHYGQVRGLRSAAHPWQAAAGHEAQRGVLRSAVRGYRGRRGERGLAGSRTRPLRSSHEQFRVLELWKR